MVLQKQLNSDLCVVIGMSHHNNLCNIQLDNSHYKATLLSHFQVSSLIVLWASFYNDTDLFLFRLLVDIQVSFN